MKRIVPIAVLVAIFYSQSLIAMESSSIQDTTKKNATTTNSIQDTTKKNATSITATQKSTNKNAIPKSKLGIDLMVLMTGEEKEVEIRKFSTKFIYYSSPSETTMKQIDRRLVNIIYYRSGRKEVITPKAVDIPQNNEWEKIKVTEDPKDVGPTMIEIDVIEVVVEASGQEQYYKPQTLESSAYIILKKKAAMLNGVLVLIKRKSHNRPYGEPPSLTIQAIAYRKI